MYSWIFRINSIEIGLLDWRVNTCIILVASAKIFSKGVCTILHSCRQFSTTFGPTAVKRFLSLMAYEVTGHTMINSLINSSFIRFPVIARSNQHPPKVSREHPEVVQELSQIPEWLWIPRGRHRTVWGVLMARPKTTNHN